MKKLLCILFTFTLLSGCVAHPQLTPSETTLPMNTDTTPAISNVPDSTETEPVPLFPQRPMVAVSMPLNIEIAQNDDGNVIFRSTKQSMQLTMRDPDVADKIILDYLNRVDVHSQAIDAVHDAAEAAYAADANWSTYFYDLIFNPTRTDHGVLSLYGEAVSYSGGNHPQRVCLSANYNMITGEVLTLGSILYHIDSKNKLTELAVSELRKIAEEKYLLDDYEDIARQRFGRDESFDEDWYFTNEGLCFYFAPYEIAPYSSGVISIQIPYSSLAGVIDDAFFPAETDLSEGTLHCVAFESADMAKFSQITEVNIDPDGQMFFLYTDGVIRNVQINQSIVSDSAYGYTQTYTIFQTYTLTPGDAIMLKIPTTENIPALTLSYEGSTQNEITLSSEYFYG